MRMFDTSITLLCKLVVPLVQLFYVSKACSFTDKAGYLGPRRNNCSSRHSLCLWSLRFFGLSALWSVGDRAVGLGPLNRWTFGPKTSGTKNHYGSSRTRVVLTYSLLRRLVDSQARL
jgi:hypothetical protein